MTEPPAAPRRRDVAGDPAPRSFAESLAGADSAADAERRRGLRRMKVVALSFLLGATVIFLVCTWAQSHGAAPPGSATSAPQRKRAWSARWPTGSRSPRCSSIRWVSRSRTPRSSSARRTNSARVSGAFVRENFMSPEVVETKLRDAEVAGRLGKWLSEPAHAERVAAETSTALRVLVEMLRDEDVQHVLDRMIVKRIAEPTVGSADRPGAGYAAGRGPAGSAHPTAGRPGVPVVAQRAARSSSASSSATRRPGRRAGSTTSSAIASIAS